jgi:hypothetical protein
MRVGESSCKYRWGSAATEKSLSRASLAPTGITATFFVARLPRDEALSAYTKRQDRHFTDDGCALNPQNATIPETINDIARGRCR